MTGHADVVCGRPGAPMRAEGPQTTGSSVVVDDSAGAPMRAKGPKRPNRKLMSIKFKQHK